jgi:hypothetical protein
VTYGVDILVPEIVLTLLSFQVEVMQEPGAMISTVGPKLL